MTEKESCFIALDKLVEIIKIYQDLLIKEPGSRHPDCYLNVNIEGEEFYIQRSERDIVMIKVDNEESVSRLTDCNIPRRIEGAKTLPELLNLAKSYNSWYLKETETAIELLVKALPTNPFL